MKEIKPTLIENIKDLRFFNDKLLNTLSSKNNAEKVEEAINDCKIILENIRISYNSKSINASNNIEKIE